MDAAKEALTNATKKAAEDKPADGEQQVRQQSHFLEDPRLTELPRPSLSTP
jgi:hypothetical protein